MCGIVAVVRCRSRRTPPTASEVLELVNSAVTSLWGRASDTDLGALTDTVSRLTEADHLLRGIAGTQTLIGHRVLRTSLGSAMAELNAEVGAIETALDQSGIDVTEATNAVLLQIKDAIWSINCDRLNAAEAVMNLAGANPHETTISAFASIQIALDSLDRLEVRGRDSAGIHLMITNHGLDLTDRLVAAALAERAADPLFRSGSVRQMGNLLGFVYKAASEIGELGDNTSALRAAITNDALLAQAVSGEGAEVTVIGHTRWASVGIISEANAHPLDSTEDLPYVVGALNGDIDNHIDLIAHHGLTVNPAITTDAKVFPTLMSSHLTKSDPTEAFRQTVTALDGSVAIAAQAENNPDQLMLALQGSGQALYVGLAEDAYVVASEPYGLVSETSRYLRLDSETAADADQLAANQGQIVILNRDQAGTIEGIQRLGYDGTSQPVGPSDIATAEITTRDIDRRGFPHFLLKEITEAPQSFRKTLRGRIVTTDEGLAVHIGPETLPEDIAQRLASGAIKTIYVIGQGTAAVAGQSLAYFLAADLQNESVRVQAIPATELSGFGLRSDMSDALVVAISQSGTTTDTNRTVNLVHRRGAAVIVVVNRRDSDLCDKADGVLYTSDGRDVEMSVASTKAFYSQIAAGVLLAAALADAINGGSPTGQRATTRQQRLHGLRELPEAMTEVLAQHPRIADIARQTALDRKYWAVVGNGFNRVAAEEIRIKLSELCYKSIACDTTEDKKHIDLASEPLILVCATGLTDSTADDVAKEVAIFRAHKAAPVVITSGTSQRFDGALEVITTPEVVPELAFLLATVVGHLFGYESALAIDELAQPWRETRAIIEAAVAGGQPGMDHRLTIDDQLLRQLRQEFTPYAQQFFQRLRQGHYDGCLDAGLATEVASLYRYAQGITPLDSYQLERGRIGTPAVVLEDLTTVLTMAISELTRPVDAIRHQAKTVTVGISRADESLLELPLIQTVLIAGANRHQLSYQTLKTLAALDLAVAEVTGYIRYSISGDPENVTSTIHVIDRAGIAVGLESRADRDPTLRGSKHLMAVKRQVQAARGRSDGRTIVLIPEVKDRQTTGITLLHIRFHPNLTPEIAQRVLEGYHNRFAALHDEVTETEPSFRLDRLADISTEDLLLTPIVRLADQWRS